MGWRRFNLARFFFWLMITPLSYITLPILPRPLSQYVSYVTLLSLLALVESAWTAYRADDNKEILKAIKATEDRILQQMKEHA